VSNLWRSGQKSQGVCRRDFWAPQVGSFGFEAERAQKNSTGNADAVTSWLPHGQRL